MERLYTKNKLAAAVARAKHHYPIGLLEHSEVLRHSKHYNKGRLL